MALILDATTAWSSPVTLTEDEVWQTRSGLIHVSTTGSPAAEDGIALSEGSAVQFAAGRVVRYRKTGTTEAVIVREAV